MEEMNFNVFKPIDIQRLRFSAFPDVDFFDTTTLSTETDNDLNFLNMLLSYLDSLQPEEQPIETPVEQKPTNTFNLVLLKSIQRYLGIPYVWGGNSDKGLDCSGFTRKVFNDMGIKLKGNAVTQYNDTIRVPIEDVKVGDLIFLKGTILGRDINSPSHVAIVTDTSLLDKGKLTVAESSGSGRKSENGRVWDLTRGYYKDHFLGVGRVSV